VDAPLEKRVRDPIDDCVHCGFCLPVCPTYRTGGEEMESPRGRIELARAVRDGRLPLDTDVASHLDLCLGCMACVTVCPSGVRYDAIILKARASIEEAVPRPAMERIRRGGIFALFPRPGRLRVMVPLLWLYQRSGLQWLVRRSRVLRFFPHLAQLDALLPRVRLGAAMARLPERTPAAGAQRLRVALVEGCVQRVFFPDVNAATVRVLAAEGCEVVVPPGQGCCGALSAHAGRADEARRMARALVEKLEAAPVDVIAVNAAGCGSHLKELGRLLGDDPAWAGRAAAVAARVRDVSEILASLPAVAPRHPLPAKVAYHPACHLHHAQGVRSQPQALLRAIPGVELTELPDTCCGSAGVYNLLQVDSARAIGERKVEIVRSARPDVLASANPGCLLQLAKHLADSGEQVPMAHPIELLDRSIRGGR
jgi:glycolate oxidase iron-sulfur subunit